MKEEVIKFLEDWFGVCEEPYENDCAGCMATKLVKLIKGFDNEDI